MHVDSFPSLLCFLSPFVDKSKKNVSWFQKVLWTIFYVTIFQALSLIPVYGQADIKSLPEKQKKTNSLFGTLMHVNAGMTPLFTCDVVISCLVKLNVICCDENDERQKRKLQALNEFFGLLVSFVVSVVYTFSGLYGEVGTDMGYFKATLIVCQFIIVAFLCLSMDALCSAGFGFQCALPMDISYFYSHIVRFVSTTISVLKYYLSRNFLSLVRRNQLEQLFNSDFLSDYVHRLIYTLLLLILASYLYAFKFKVPSSSSSVTSGQTSTKKESDRNISLSSSFSSSSLPFSLSSFPPPPLPLLDTFPLPQPSSLPPLNTLSSTPFLPVSLPPSLPASSPSPSASSSSSLITLKIFQAGCMPIFTHLYAKNCIVMIALIASFYVQRGSLLLPTPLAFSPSPSSFSSASYPLSSSSSSPTLTSPLNIRNTTNKGRNPGATNPVLGTEKGMFVQAGSTGTGTDLDTVTDDTNDDMLNNGESIDIDTGIPDVYPRGEGESSRSNGSDIERNENGNGSVSLLARVISAVLGRYAPPASTSSPSPLLSSSTSSSFLSSSSSSSLSNSSDSEDEDDDLSSLSLSASDVPNYYLHNFSSFLAYESSYTPVSGFARYLVIPSASTFASIFSLSKSSPPKETPSPSSPSPSPSSFTSPSSSPPSSSFSLTRFVQEIVLPAAVFCGASMLFAYGFPTVHGGGVRDIEAKAFGGRGGEEEEEGEEREHGYVDVDVGAGSAAALMRDAESGVAKVVLGTGISPGAGTKTVTGMGMETGKRVRRKNLKILGGSVRIAKLERNNKDSSDLESRSLCELVGLVQKGAEEAEEEAGENGEDFNIYEVTNVRNVDNNSGYLDGGTAVERAMLRRAVHVSFGLSGLLMSLFTLISFISRSFFSMLYSHSMTQMFNGCAREIQKERSRKANEKRGR